MDEWIDTVARRLGSPIFTDGDEVRFNCWRRDCGSSGTLDSKYHLYVNPTSGKYFCQRCQRGGTLEYLAKALGVEAPGKSLLQWDRVINAFLYGEDNAEAKLDTSLAWPDEYVAIFPGTQAYNYLHSRGITDEMIQFYQIGFGTGFLKNRVIFPDVDKDDKLVYWVARDYAEDRPRAKYRNADAPREKQVFNLGRIERSKCRDRLVITEGPISAIIAGYDAVSTYGKYVTGEQIDKIAKFEASEYVIAGDGDALYDAISLATRLHRRGLNVKFVRMTGDEDPASIGSLEIKKRIDCAPRWSAMSSLEMMV